jgi:hypothetical protein
LETYAKHAPYPHCNIIGQEIFDAGGAGGSYTDYKIFWGKAEIGGGFLWGLV